MKMPLYCRRISALSDLEGKTRIIGVLDYWTQTVLRPIHNMLNNILRRLPQDCTFDQKSFIHKLSKPEAEKFYFSFDLTNATDRMPIKLQQTIIAKIIGEAKAEIWAKILVSLPFAHKESGSLYFYATGQPMGAYSS